VVGCPGRPGDRYAPGTGLGEYGESLTNGIPQGERHSAMLRLLDLIRVVLGWAIVLVGMMIVVTAAGARVVRQYGEYGNWGNTTATDGIRQWQAWALLCVMVTGVVLIAVLWADRPRWWLLPISIAGFVLVALNVNAWHDRLLAEQAGPRTYVTDVRVRPASGPIVDERGFPLHFEAVTRVYEMRIPGEIEVVVVSSFAAAGLISILMLLFIAEDLLRRRQPRAESMAMTAI